MKKFKLKELLEQSGQYMGEQLRSKLISHPGELGRNREEIIKQFLRSHLPKRFGVESGFVFDQSGKTSKQIDIVIFDDLSCPRFEMPGGLRMFPVESVLAVGQVKSALNSRNVLIDALDNIASVKSLDRSGAGQSIDRKTGRILDPESCHLDSVFGFVFASGDSLSPEVASEVLNDFCVKNERIRWTNLVFSLDRYLLTYECPRGVCPNTYDAEFIVHQAIQSDKHILLRFFVLLGRALEVTSSGSIEYGRYIGGLQNWPGRIMLPLGDCEPPIGSAF